MASASLLTSPPMGRIDSNSLSTGHPHMSLSSLCRFARGEAGVAIVLKRLDLALKDRDYIYGTVRNLRLFNIHHGTHVFLLDSWHGYQLCGFSGSSQCPRGCGSTRCYAQSLVTNQQTAFRSGLCRTARDRWVHILNLYPFPALIPSQAPLRETLQKLIGSARHFIAKMN